MPETVLAMVQARIEDLDPEARRALRAASVLGEVLWQGAAARLLGAGRDDPALAAELLTLEQREWIVRQRGARFAGEVEYTFRHGLLREAAYGMLTEADRRLGHHLAGLWLEEAGERDALVLADHLERGGEPGAAARWYERAAEQALEAGDLEGALARGERALACAPPPEAAGRLHALAATAHNWRGAYAEAERAAKAALDLSPEGSRARHAALAMLSWASGALGKVEQLEALASALSLADPGAPLDRDLVLTWHSVSGWLRELGRGAAAAALERRTAQIRPEDLDPSLAAYVYAMHSYTANYAHRIEPALRFAEAACRAHERCGAFRDACLMRTSLGILQMHLGAYPEAEASCEEARRVAVQLKIPYGVNAATMALGRILLARGRCAEARALAAGVVEAAVASRNGRQAGIARAVLALVLLETGEIDEARAEAAAAAEAAGPYPSLRAGCEAILAQALLRQGRAEEALALARRASAVAERQGSLDDEHARVRLVLAEALHACALLDEARAAITAARAWLHTQADTLDAPDLRHKFLYFVPEHARILALAEAWGA